MAKMYENSMIEIFDAMFCSSSSVIYTYENQPVQALQKLEKYPLIVLN